jgi:hypothetical protein
MMPDFVGAFTLLVYEEYALTDVSDLCDPFHRDAKQWPYLVSDHHSFIHFLRNLCKDIETHVRRSDLAEVLRR